MKVHYLAALGGLLLFCAPHLYSEENIPAVSTESTSPIKAGDKMETLTLADGKEYKKVTILKILPYQLSIMHEAGTARISMEKLTDETRARFNFVSKEEAQKLINARRKAQIASAQRATEARAAQESKRTPAPQSKGQWVTTNEYNPRFKKLLSQAKAVAGVRHNGRYTKGLFKGKNELELLLIVKAAYRRKYKSSQYYGRYLVDNGGGGGEGVAHTGAHRNPDMTWVCGGAYTGAHRNPDMTWVCGGAYGAKKN